MVGLMPFPKSHRLVAEELLGAGDIGERVANVAGAGLDAADLERAPEDVTDFDDQVVERDAPPPGDVDHLAAKRLGGVGREQIGETTFLMKQKSRVCSPSPKMVIGLPVSEAWMKRGMAAA